MVFLFIGIVVASTGVNPSALSDTIDFPIYTRRYSTDVCSSSAAFCFPLRLCMHAQWHALLLKFGYFMPWYALGRAFMLTGSALMYTVDPETSATRIYGYTIIFGIGIGFMQQTGYAVAQAAYPHEKTPAAIDFINITQIISVACALRFLMPPP
jgi:hypothetical protein